MTLRFQIMSECLQLQSQVLLHYYIVIIFSQQLDMDPNCIVCGAKYDYFDRIATTVCNQGHTTCKLCSLQLKRTKSRCPYCLEPLINSTPLQQPLIQPTGLNSPVYVQPNQIYSVQAQPYWQPQVIPVPVAVPNAAPMVGQIQISEQRRKRPLVYFLVGLILLITGVCLIMLRVQMDKCSYWTMTYNYDCYYGDGKWYCCPDSSNCSSDSYKVKCFTIDHYRSPFIYTFVLICIFISFITSIFTCIMAIAAKCRSSAVPAGNGYVMIQ